MSTAKSKGTRKAPAKRPAAKKPSPKAKVVPIEYSMLLTTTLCLLALGVVMVFSASSTTSLLGDAGDGAFYLKRTALYGIVGLLALKFLASGGVKVLRPLTVPLMALSLFLLVAVMIPGVGIEVNGANRWIGAGLFQIQPSEIAKVALILYGAQLLASRPKMTRSIGEMGPFLLAVALVSGLVVLEPDLGTAMVACFAAAAMLIAAGARLRDLAILAGAIGVVIVLAIMIEPYRMERLTGFLNPGSDPSGSGFQANQAQIALGSGGLFGVGLGESLQKAFYLPEAHTDMIAAVIGEELGLVGIAMIIGLFSLFGYAGLQTARKARDPYAKLLAAGLTSLIVIQAVINLFAVLGLAPLTGVPLPFVSYGNSSLLTMLAAVGVLLNIARAPGARLRVVNGDRTAQSRSSGGRHSRARRARAGSRRRATG
ncbi:MAG: cell division protein FtsW [Solirubrobacterales bacterium]|nr:cell division protein FtsW [Solirubrobacterales bacterium]